MGPPQNQARFYAFAVFTRSMLLDWIKARFLTNINNIRISLRRLSLDNYLNATPCGKVEVKGVKFCI